MKMKIGRNDPCPCKSGKKYKKCCGNPLKKQTGSIQQAYRPFHEDMHKMLERHKANELIRLQQQGLGNPIVSCKFKDQQMVAVGDTVYFSKNWKTFPDFLPDYLKRLFGREWWSNEIKKALAGRHQILQWAAGYYEYQKKHMGKPGEIKSSPFVGVGCCYLGLAYNLYLLKHNVELQERFINRLKNTGNFQGAYYELIVANCLIRAGFELSLEDEADESSKHCEFAAISKKTGKKYWVEAKMRSVDGYFGKTDKDGTKDMDDPTGMLSKHVSLALKKPATDERLIFVDLNAEPTTDGSKPPWVERAGKKLDMRERNLLTGQSAYVFVTNMPFHRVLDSAKLGHAVMAHGLGISDFAKPGDYTLTELYKRKEKYIDAHNIIESIREYPKIPTTFDGSLPSEAFGGKSQRVVIGETYFFEDIGSGGVVGTVTTAFVAESDKTIHLAIRTEDEENHIITKPMSDDEFTDYKNHPEAYFGILQQASRKAKDPYDLFEFFVDSYRNTPKEHMLELFKDASDIDSLRGMEHMDLVLECCERWVASALNDKRN